MKQIIAVMLALLITVSTLSTSVFAFDGMGEFTGDSETIEIIKNDNKTPCYGDYEIIFDENEYSTMAADKKDQYESNNSFMTATSLNSQPVGRPSNFTVNRSATLHRESWIFGLIERNVDEDYYRFDTFGNATVSISLTNIPVDCDYDIKLYMFDNDRYVEAEDISFIAGATKSNNANETLTRTLKPGRYFLWIYSYNDSCDDSTYYNLSVSVTYTAENYNISSLKYDKGAKAALWISDYDPCGILPYSEAGRVKVGFWSGEPLNSASMFENPYTNYFNSGDRIEQAVLYIWDEDTRDQLRTVIISWYDDVNDKLEDDNQLLLTLDIIEAGAGVASTVGGILVKVYSAGSEVYSKAFEALPTVATILKYLIAPSEEVIITKETWLAYLWDLRTALEVGEQTGSEVVRIVSAYTYVVENYIGILQSDYYYDYTPICQENYIYNSDTIYSWNDSSIVHGTIYGIIDDEDFENARAHGSNYLPDVNTSTIQTIYTDSSIPGTLNVGEYHWYKFTAPSSGTYSFFTENSIDTYGELFSAVVPARSITGLLAENDDIDEEENTNFRINYNLSAGQVVYLRVRGFFWMVNGNYSVRVTRIS